MVPSLPLDLVAVLVGGDEVVGEGVESNVMTVERGAVAEPKEVTEACFDTRVLRCDSDTTSPTDELLDNKAIALSMKSLL